MKNRLIRWVIVFCVMLYVGACLLFGQTTQITASHIAYFGGQTFNGQFCVTPTDGNGNAINLVSGGGQQLAPQSTLCFPVSNGLLSSAAFVPDTSLTNPANACLKLTLLNRAGQPVGTYPCLQPSGVTWSFDAYVPSSMATIPAMSLPQFQLNGNANPTQTYLDLVCSGCTVTGGHITIPNGSGSSTYTAAGTGGTSRTVNSKFGDTLSIKDFGGVGDGAHMSADSAALIAVVNQASIGGQKVYIPAGTYNLNNSSAAALSGAKNVLIYGDGPSTILSCNTVGASDCIASTGATGFGLKDLAINFATTATTRSSGYALNVQSCTSCTFEGISLNNGDLSGMRLASSVHTTIRNLAISNFFANGLFAINNQDLRVQGESCTNNQDACFEVSWFDSQFTTYAIPCEQITATNIVSNNDTEAVLINGCRNVTVDGFTATGSGKEAVFVGQDPTTTTLHWPDRIVVSNGTIYGSGYGTNANNTATAQALYINMSTTPSYTSHITFSNISATHISGWGLQMAELQTSDVDLANVTFYDVGNGDTEGCLQTEGNQISLANVSCTDVGTYGLYDQNTLRLTGTGLSFNAVSQVSGIDAIYLASTATGFLNLTNINIADTNTTTFSSEVYDASTTGQHSMWNISTTYVTSAGYLAPTAANSGTTYTYTDPGHSMVFRNGGMIQSFVPPNYYFLPTAGATSGAYVNGAVLYYQSKCWASGAQQVESVGWLDQYPTLSTESFSFNHTGGCGFPIVIDMTGATTVAMPQATAASYNNVAVTTPASLATFTLLSGITFAVNKTMTLSCSGGCGGTYNLDALAPLASPALTGTPSAPTAAAQTNTTQIATTANVVASIPGNTLPFTAYQTAPAFYPQTTGAGAYANWFDDFFSAANNSSNNIGSPTGASCSANNTLADANHPGNILLTDGTGGTGTGITCGLQSTSGALVGLNATPTWVWETAVKVPTLPGTTAASYQAGLTGGPNVNPWTTGIGWYLSSANGTANDWYCRYSSTSTDSTVAAVASTWTRLTMVQDGTYVHWYINGTEATACKTAIASMPSTTMYAAAWAVTALGSTSTTMAVDYVAVQRAVVR